MEESGDSACTQTHRSSQSQACCSSGAEVPQPSTPLRAPRPPSRVARSLTPTEMGPSRWWGAPGSNSTRTSWHTAPHCLRASPSSGVMGRWRPQPLGRAATGSRAPIRQESWCSSTEPPVKCVRTAAFTRALRRRRFRAGFRLQCRSAERSGPLSGWRTRMCRSRQPAWCRGCEPSLNRAERRRGGQSPLHSGKRTLRR